MTAPVIAGTEADALAGRFFYGWVMAPLATLVMVASAPGQTYGVMFFTPVIREALGLTQTRLSATYLLATLCAALPLSYLGALSDRHGLKRSMLAAITALAASCLFASTVHTAFTLFLAFVGLRMIGAGLMSLLATNTLAAWFDRRLGVACGVMQFGTAVSMAAVPITFITLIGAVGWRNAYVVLGFAQLFGLLPLVLMAYREHPRDVGQFVDGLAPHSRRSLGVASDWDSPSLNLREAMRTSMFWLLLVATAVWSLIGTGLMFHLESLLEACRLTREQAAWATPLIAAAMATVQLGSGVLVDRVSIRWLISAALVCAATCCAMLAAVSGLTALAAYAAYGIGQGLMSVVSSASWARYFGPTHLGRIRGTSMTVGIASSAMGPLVLGASADFLGGFQPSLWLFAGLAVTVAANGLKPESARGGDQLIQEEALELRIAA
jgi:MFS family permease